MSLHFIRAEWLLGLLPLAILLVMLWRQKLTGKAWQAYIAPHLAKALIAQSTPQKRHHLLWLALAWFIAILAISGPAITKQRLPVFAAEQGRVLVMDMSLSMYATDLAPNRLAQARFRAIDILNDIKEGETGLVAYAGDAFTISPLTRDTATLLNLLPTLSPDIMPVRGSNMAKALEQAKALLTQGGHIKGDIIVITDGVSARGFDQSVPILEDSHYRLSILAIGTAQGAPIKLPDGQLMRDQSNDIVVAKTDYPLLQRLSSASQGRVFPVNADGSDVRQLVDWLAVEDQAVETELTGEVWLDLGPYIALLLLVPVLLSFQHGLIAGLFLCILLPTPQARADTWQDLWQTKNQQAQQAYDAKEFANSAENFDNTQWRASALYKNGDYEKALQAFEQDQTATGQFNQGNALMQLQQFSEAKQRYQQAIAQQPDFAEAKANLKLAESLEKQQQPSSDSGNDQNESDDQDPSDSQESKQQSQDQQQGQSSESEQSQGDPSDQHSPEQQSSKPTPPKPQDNQSQNTGSDQPEQENQQEQSQENDKSQEQASQNKMQADPQQQNLSEQQESQTQANATQSNSEASEQPTETGEENATTAMPTDAEQVPPEALPADMARALNAIKEDPQVLLRNKMQLEYEKRRQRGELSREKEQW